MNNKAIAVLSAILALALILSVKAAFLEGQGDRERQGKAEEAAEPGQAGKTEAGDAREKEVILKDYENIYYLAGNLPEFREQLAAFLERGGHSGNPVTVTALSKYEDQQGEEMGKARFYFQADDGTVVSAVYDKGTGNFAFSECTEEIANIEDYGGRAQERAGSLNEPEYGTEGTLELDLGFPAITDNEGQLAAVEPDQEGLARKVLAFLESVQEERRNLSVLSAEETGRGYEAVLLFENPRMDGKYISVSYSRESRAYQVRFSDGE